jgi:tetratricopeptide (TPR) repeat protein
LSRISVNVFVALEIGSGKFENKAFFFTRTYARLGRARTLARLDHADAASAFRDLLADEKLIGPMSDTSFWDALAEAPLAQQVYRDWLAERPTDAAAWRMAAGRFSAAGCIDDALHAWDRVITLAPTDHFAWFGMAETFAKVKRYDEAIDAFQRSLALKPGFLGAQARLEVVQAEARAAGTLEGA